MHINSTRQCCTSRQTSCTHAVLPSAAVARPWRAATASGGCNRLDTALPQLLQLQVHCVSLNANDRQPTWLTHAASDQPAAPAAAPTASSDQPAAAAAAELPACQPLDILKATTADGKEVFLEVISTSGSSAAQQVCVALEGVTYQLQPSSNSSSSSSSSSSDQSPDLPWVLQPQGWVLQPSSDLVKALPGWPAALQQQQARQKLPQQPLLLQALERVYSAAALQAAVQQNPAPWRDGTGPNDPPVKGLQYQTLCAGEIEALLAGQRGVVMVQLWVGWDAAAPQPVYNCLVLEGLRRALARRDVSIFISKAAGGLGLTAILAAQVEPFRSWGAHLASFGGQAAVVADSAFYKLLIGRILGYAEPNIKHHILATTGRPVAPEVAAAVDKELAALSKQKPRLPWKAGPPAAAAAAAGAGSSRPQQAQAPAGQQRKQQLSRSARKKMKG